MLRALWNGLLVRLGLHFGAIFGGLAVTWVPWERLGWRLGALLPPLVAYPLSHKVFHRFSMFWDAPGGVGG